MFSRCLFFAVLALVVSPLYAVAQETATEQHSHMNEEHSTAGSDHLAWRAKIGKMRAEHQSALAALARLQADLLEHEAELEMMTVHIDMHEMEMASHDDAMSAHEESGEGAQHDELSTEHADVMGAHAKMEKMIEAAEAHHKDMIEGIMKFAGQHMKEFHSHDHGETSTVTEGAHGHGSHSKGGHAEGHDHGDGSH